MKQFRHIVLLISLVWMAEDLASFIHLNLDASPVAIEWSEGEKIEKKLEFETKEYLCIKYVPQSLLHYESHMIVEATFYKSPVLSIPDVPPEYSC